MIGQNDGSDLEFAQSNYQLDFNVNHQSSNNCAKELNLYNLTTQYFHFELNQNQLGSDLSINLSAAWSNSQGLLKVALEKWNQYEWVPCGYTYLNQKYDGFLEIPRGLLYQGTNTFRLIAIEGTDQTNVITWDFIDIESLDQHIIFSVGSNDNSSAELNNGAFPAVWTVADGSSQFPKELNLSWWQHQYFHFNLTSPESEQSAYLSFDVAWNDGSHGTILTAIDRWNGQDWQEIGQIELSVSRSGRIEIQPEYLIEGLNEYRLRAVSGSNGTSVVVWDQITLWQRFSLPQPMVKVLSQIVDATLNYWLSNDVIHSSGLPLTALKSTDRARFGYSNPTEWGYALQAWVVAAQFGKITVDQAITKIQTALNTMWTLQQDPTQFSHGLFFPYYTLVNHDGQDNIFPVADSDSRLPSGDCALLWGSINVVEGWLREQNSNVADLAYQVKSNMSFRSCFFVDQNQNASIAHQVDANTNQLSDSTWNIFSDEGGVVNFIAYLSDSITVDEYQSVHNFQNNDRVSWNGHSVEKGSYFNSAFTWPQRLFVGYPLSGGLYQRQYMEGSFIPNFRAHLDWVNAKQVDHMGFSDAMTQLDIGMPLVGNYVAPNLASRDDMTTNDIYHIQPHGAIVPFLASQWMEMGTLIKIYEHVLFLMTDHMGYWHDESNDPALPFGFEVVASPYLNHDSYTGADDGRDIFESLSQSYVLFPAAYALQKVYGWNTFEDYARSGQNVDYDLKVENSLQISYSNPKS